APSQAGRWCVPRGGLPSGQQREGLMVACYHGFGSIVALLSCCPFLDVNQQDKDGNTALMLAAQAGHMSLVTLLLNYFAGLDLERRDQRGLTALMKAAIQDRSECVVALLMAGADLSSVDPVRGKTALEWAVLTDSFDTAQKIRQLLRRPQAEQLSLHYQPEWPALAQLVAQAQAQAQAPAAPSLLERLQATLSLSFAQSPQEGGVLDHLVTVTTSLAIRHIPRQGLFLLPSYLCQREPAPTKYTRLSTAASAAEKGPTQCLQAGDWLATVVMVVIPTLYSV
ncbi:ankyrin repeat domain 33, isoform CRA_a, partial [Mus musculus]